MRTRLQVFHIGHSPVGAGPLLGEFAISVPGLAGGSVDSDHPSDQASGAPGRSRVAVGNVGHGPHQIAELVSVEKAVQRHMPDQLHGQRFERAIAILEFVGAHVASLGHGLWRGGSGCRPVLHPSSIDASSAAGNGSSDPHPLSAATGRPRARDWAILPRLAGAFGLRPLSGALVLSLALAGCEADHVGAKDALLEWGYTGIGITPGPMFDRPCRVGQPYAVRFTAHDATGALRSGWVCASDEFAHDGLIFLDREAS